MKPSTANDNVDTSYKCLKWLNSLQINLIRIINNAINQKSYTLGNDFELDDALITAQQHNTVNMLFYGLKNSNYSEYANEVFSTVYSNILQDEFQRNEIKKICDEFNKNNIDFSTLKGVNLKKLYPSTDMREMGDADILIRSEQYEQIKQIMKRLGFVFIKEEAHDFAWQNSKLYIELHKSLFDDYRDIYSEVTANYKNSWSLMHPTGNGSEYTFSPEDEFIYLFAHFTKHYKLSGIGIRHLTDLWVFHRANPDIDMQYVKEHLRQMNLLEFFENVWNTALCWFDGKEFDEMSEYISNEILSGGSFGTLENQVLSDFIAKEETGTGFSLKFKRNLKYIFLPYKAMAVKYPILNKIPIALPITWVLRLIDIAVNKRQTLSKYIEEEKFISCDKIAKRKKSLKYVGLKCKN